MKKSVQRILAVLVCGSCLYLLLLKILRLHIPCLIKKLTGFYCPACGISRMFLFLLKGNFYQAFRMNPLFLLLLPVFLYFLLDFVCKFMLDRHNYVIKKVPKKAWYILIIIIFAFGILRNIPIFDFLTPIYVKIFSS